MSRILVTGVGGPAGRGLAETLADMGHAVLGTDMAPPPSSRTVRTAQVPAADDAAFAPALFALAAGWQADLIVPTVTEELTVADLHTPTGPCAVAVAPHRAARIAEDKWLTYLHLTEAGLPVPRSVLPGPQAHRRLTDGDPDAEAEGRFLSKPRRGRGARGVRLHESAAEACTAPAGAIVQEFVPGTEYAVQVFRSPAEAEENLEHAVVLEKTELAAGLVGNGRAVRRLADQAPDVAALGLRSARALGLTGPADVDVRRRADGTAVVLEVNARVGAHVAHVPEIARAIVDAYLPITV